jgi:hypothetical protein
MWLKEKFELGPSNVKFLASSLIMDDDIFGTHYKSLLYFSLSTMRHVMLWHHQMHSILPIPPAQWINYPRQWHTNAPSIPPVAMN